MRASRGLDTAIGEGAKQTVWYMDRCGAESGHLVILDQRPGKSWEERVFQREEIVGETPVTVWGIQDGANALAQEGSRRPTRLSPAAKRASRSDS